MIESHALILSVWRQFATRRAGIAATVLLALPLGFMGLSFSTPAEAHHLVSRHTLHCGDTFPCPAELQRRIDFWVLVFSKWRTDHAILHDSKYPERVYSVSPAKACSGSGSRSMTGQRKKLQARLRGLASKLESGNTQWSKTDLHILEMFARRKPAELRLAAKRVRCQQGNRDRFAKALQRFGAYRPMIEKSLAQAKLPADIVYLPFVESAYNPNAYSRVGAAGLWQIMPRTARNLGLEVSASLDERMDPEQATLGATRYFQRSIEKLTAAAKSKQSRFSAGQINPFVVTSYNYGVAGMSRALRQFGPDYIKVLREYRSRSFRTAVRNFYASFIAARYVATHAEEYFGKTRAHAPQRYNTVVLKRGTSIERISKVFGVSVADLKPLNRALTKNVWRGYRLAPAGYRLKLPRRADSWAPLLARLEQLPAEDGPAGGGNYRVKRGDTACGIASAFRVSCRELIAANNLGRRALIRVGQKLVVPGTAQTVAAAGGNIPATHRVRRGDTACGIARRYGVDCRRLIAENRLGKSALIRAGQSLSIPGGGVVKAASRPATYTVSSGDTACRIAKKYSVDCRALIQANALNRRGFIRVGQVLKLPGGGQMKTADITPAPQPPVQVATAKTAPRAHVTAESEQPKSASAIFAQELNYDLTEGQYNGKRVYTLEVEADETLGHYADWLGVGGTATLRKVNRLGRSHVVHLGRRLQIPIKDDAVRETFQMKRRDYHRLLLEQFHDRFEIVGVDQYRIKSGDSVWTVARNLSLPMWVLDRFNPSMRGRRPQIGDILAVPVIRSKSAS
ncbi:MAG: LysM peptidoglycan-binding domain-containing protein [Gammaproteobacteria bacterium]|nr:LysM peptidoglycan-binding domain-containing protein [Gammaproteobacteria bacterium]MDH3465045.1 LysM peptidoglycan-binding domain-containing protein [Gammaproteobacteria bacterium]